MQNMGRHLLSWDHQVIFCSRLIGAGKSTLLGILTEKFVESSTKKRKGQCLANGQPYTTNDFNSFGVFVMQNDLLFPCLSVKGFRVHRLFRNLNV